METKMIRIASGLALISLLGCGAEQSRPTGSVSTDSAGIRIIAGTDTPPQLDVTPIVSIGALQGDEAHTFNEIVDVELRNNGSVYVLDSGDNTVKVYDLSGQHLFSFGHEGEGPEEFLAASALISWPDTIAVFDRRLQKIAKFDPDTGTLLGTERVPYSVSLVGFPTSVERLSSGRYLIVGSLGCQLPRTTDASRWRVVIAQANAGITDTLDNRAYGNSLPFYGEGDSFCGAPSFPFGASPVLAADAAYVAVASGDRGEVRIYHEPRPLQDPDEIWRYEVPPTPLTANERTEYESQFADEEPELRDAFLKALDERGFPPEWPRIIALLIDGAGQVWAQRGAPADAEYRTWDVLGSQGSHVAIVRFPSGVRLQAVGSDYAVGIGRDELDVQHVELFRIPDLDGLSPQHAPGADAEGMVSNQTIPARSSGADR